MAMWNPFRGCHKCSDGCKFCYIHKGDYKKNVDTDKIVKTDNFYAPILKNKKGDYKMKSNQLVNLCFSSDFLIEEADKWRDECWAMIRERSDLSFLFLTKRIDRLEKCLPSDWNDGYNNVTIGCTIENQKIANYRLNIFDNLPIKHRNIIAQPLLGPIDLSNHLTNIELVVVGGESDYNGRILNYDWVLDIREQCIKENVSFNFRQLGTNFFKDNKYYQVNTQLLSKQAKKANIDFIGN
jgi:protein gp37